MTGSAVPRWKKGLLLMTIGYILSPLSWWNDLFVNMPIAYGIAVLFSFIDRKLFMPALVGGYWATNVLGLFLMHEGVSRLRDWRQDPRQRGWVSSLLWSSFYTGLIVLLVYLKVIKPPF